MARDTPASVEIEASSFSVWNCVITFLQILLISTMLYGAGWNQGQIYNLAPEGSFNYNSFRALAFFFSIWALQSVALALLLIWAIGKKSYHLCHSWMLCETLMQVFLILSSMYFAYRAAIVSEIIANENASTPDSTYDYYHHRSTNNVNHSLDGTFRPPKHLSFLIILHFLVKGFGFWIVRRYMKIVKPIHSDQENAHVCQRQGSSSEIVSTHQMSPPPSYAILCKDDLPCYDEAIKLCSEDTTLTEELTDTAYLTNEKEKKSKDLCKTPLVNV